MSSGNADMKGAAQASATQPPATEPPAKFTTWFAHCLMMGGDHPSSPVIACSDFLGPKLKVRAQVLVFKALHTGNWLSCKISFPLPDEQAASEDAGLFGRGS